MRRILMVSGSFGLGHVTRDLAIARALRAERPDVEILWLAGEPARSFLQDAGEALHPSARQYESDTAAAEGAASEGGLNLFRYLMRALSKWSFNARLIGRVAAREDFEVVVADEVYELVVGLILKQVRLRSPLVMLYDFLGLDATGGGLFERLGIQFWNRMWSMDRRVFGGSRNLALFIGEPDDIPDRAMGWGLPSRREHARRYYRFIGYVLPFEPAEVGDRRKVRAELGYGEEPLVIASVGGTAVGKELLEACGRAFPLARRSIPALRMVLVGGPRLGAGTLSVPPGVEVAGFVPRLYRHFAACDLAVVQGGGTTTLELTALRRPFVYVPVSGQCEQEIAVAGRLARHRAGIRLPGAEVTAERLAGLIVENLGKVAAWPEVPVEGARAAALQILSRFAPPGPAA